MIFNNRYETKTRDLSVTVTIGNTGSTISLGSSLTFQGINGGR